MKKVLDIFENSMCGNGNNEYVENSKGMFIKFKDFL
jgi:hypothetical protein